MNEQANIKPATWFMVVSGLALLWNLLGVYAYVDTKTMSAERLAELPGAQRQLMESTPAWANGAFAVAVNFGALGCLALLLKKAWAVPLLMLSLAGVVVQFYNAFLISNSFEVFGPGGMIMPVMVFAIAVYLVVLARSAKTKGWIH
jgi:hypothetical protein